MSKKKTKASKASATAPSDKGAVVAVTKKTNPESKAEVQKPSLTVASHAMATPSKLSPQATAWAITGLVLFVLFALASLFTIGYSLIYAHKFVPGLTIANVAVGGQHFDAAQDAVQAAARSFTDQKITLQHDTESFVVAPAEAGLTPDITSALTSAWLVGHSGDLLTDFVQQVHSLFAAQRVAVTSTINSRDFESFYSEKIRKYGTEPKNATLTISKTGAVSVEPEQDGSAVNKDLVKLALYDRIGRFDTTPIALHATPLRAAVSRTALAAVATQIPATLREQFTLTYQDNEWKTTEKQMQKWLQVHFAEIQSISDFQNEIALALTNADEIVYIDNTGAVASNLVLTADNTDTFFPVLDAQILQQSMALRTPQSFTDRALASFALYGHQRLNPPTVPVLTLSMNAIKESMAPVAKALNVPGQDARLQFTDGAVSITTASKAGQALDVSDAATKIRDAILSSSARTVALKVDVSEAEISEKNISKLGITKLIGTGTSNFAGSPKNRIFNLTLGAKKFNGAVIKPGQEFSFTGLLGEVDASTGYLPELVIKENKTVPDYGGGICQVSTTAFRAAVNTGLQVTERHQHSYAVQYYAPQGTDATIYVPKPDLRFVNNTPGHILIETKIQGNILTFNFYGTDDGRRVETKGPTIYDRKSDGSMKASWTQIVYAKDGKEMINKTFNSIYKPPKDFH